MTGEKFSKNTAVVSGVIIIVWLQALRMVSNIVQNMTARDDPLFSIVSWSSAVMIAGGLLIFAADVLIFLKKAGKTPLLISAAAAAVTPIAAYAADSIQDGSFGHDFYSSYLLSEYRHLTGDLPYLFYAGAALTVTAAAVYTFKDENIFRIASRVSQYILIIGVILQLLVFFFMLHVESIIWKWAEFISFPAIAVCLGGMLVFAAVTAMRQDKGRLAPFVISESAAILLPLISAVMSNFQDVLASCDEDTLYSSEWKFFLKYSGNADMFSYIIYAGAAVAAAAAAVRFFAAENTEMR